MGQVSLNCPVSLPTTPSKPRDDQEDGQRRRAARRQRLRLLVLSVRVTDEWANAGSPRLPFHKLDQTPSVRWS
jgi:hypothetical protein